MNLNQMRSRPKMPPKLDSSVLIAASQLRHVVHDLLHEFNIKVAEIAGDNSLTSGALKLKRSYLATVGLAQLDSITKSQMAEIESQLAAVRDRIRGLRGEPHPTLVKQEREIQNALSGCRLVISNARQVIVRHRVLRP